MGGCVIGRGSSGNEEGLEVICERPDDDQVQDYGDPGPEDLKGKEHPGESDDRRLISAYMRDLARYPLLSKEEVTKIFDEIGLWRDTIDSLILTTRYGRRQYHSLEGIVADGIKTESGNNVIEQIKSNEREMSGEEMREEFYRFLDAVRRVRTPRQGMRVLSSMRHIRLKEGVKNDIRHRFYADLLAYVEFASERKKGQSFRNYSAWIGAFGVPPPEASGLYSKFMSLDRLLKKDVDKIANSNLRLVVSIAKKYHRRGMSLMDFVQEGNIGLLKAIDCFDNSLGYSFSTYASWWINHAIRRSIGDKATTIRHPVHLLETIKKVEDYFRSDHEAEKHQDAEGIAAAIGEAQSKVRHALEAMASMYVDSLDKPMGYGPDSRTYVTAVADPHSPDPEQEIVRTGFRRVVRDTVYSVLTDRERMVLENRFGDDEEHTLKEIGDAIGVSRERIRQIQEQAIGKGRRALFRVIDPCLKDGSELSN